MLGMSGTLERYLSRLPLEMRESLESTTPRIFERCHLTVASRGDGEATQLVVGEVQSGKTSSFTALAAMGRDSGVPIVIVIAGTKKNLVKQTHERLVQDLEIGSSAGLPRWEIVDRPTGKKASKYNQTIAEWADVNRPLDFKTSLLLIVLKSSAGISHAADFMAELGESVDLSNHPILIIDDEADQAGLNVSVKRGEQSSVYKSILKLRNSISWYAYAMYTATPQANFLIDIIDELSPSRVTLLEAGKAYVGGEKLFGGLGNYVTPIPASELLVATDPSNSDSPPESLQRALAFFVVSLAVAQKLGHPKPLSMLIHPSGKQIHHEFYSRWVTDILESWKIQMRDPSEPSHFEVVQNVIVPALKSLRSDEAFPDFPFSYDNVELANYFSFLIPHIEIRVVNGVSDRHTVNPEEWNRYPGWIVIGGNKLDRGFTINNLAVTYMPRGAATNADTLQQRGRFFGYKASYERFLRGWFSEASEEMFADYVIHEKLMRARLRELDENDTDVRMWRRTFVLPNGLRATRDQVVALITNQWQLGPGFIFSQRLLYDSSVAVGYQESLEKLNKYFSIAQPFIEDTRANFQTSFVQVPILEAVELLEEWIAHPADRKKLTELAGIVREIANNRLIDATLFFMDSFYAINQPPRQRSVAFDNDPEAPMADWKIGNLFAGKQFSGSQYIGDTEVKSPNGLSLQFHRIHPKEVPDSHVALAVAVAGGQDIDFRVVEETLY